MLYFFEGLEMTGLMTALSMEGTSSTDNEAPTAGVSPGYDSIVGVFSPLLSAAGMAESLFTNYAPFIYNPVEAYLNGLITNGMIEIIGLIMPLDSETEDAIRNATEGDVDPEVEQAAKNMSEELDFSSKESFIASTVNISSYETVDEDGENEQWVMQNIYGLLPEPKKIALLIGQGAEGMEDEDNITEAVQNDLGRLADLLEEREYQLISKSNQGTDRFNYNVNKNYVDNKLFPWLKENLTNNNGLEVVICIFAHGNENGFFAFYDHDPPNIQHSYLWERFSKKLDETTLDRNEDGIISDNEKEMPMYSEMVIVVESCFSGKAIKHLKANDKAEKRIVITSTDDDENAKNTGILHFGDDHAIFLTHLMNFFDGDSKNEFWFTFVQSMNIIGLAIVAFFGLGLGAYFLWVAGPGMILLAKGLCIAFLVYLAITLILATAQLLKCYLYGGCGESVFRAYWGASLPTKWGHGLYLWGSTPQLYNMDFAYEAKL